MGGAVCQGAILFTSAISATRGGARGAVSACQHAWSREVDANNARGRPRRREAYFIRRIPRAARRLQRCFQGDMGAIQNCNVDVIRSESRRKEKIRLELFRRNRIRRSTIEKDDFRFQIVEEEMQEKVSRGGCVRC